ncbi:MAG: AAA family ATPase [Clostridia bacterium]|nr:AAA family ATPase [Clostridia bacterium]
MFVGRNKETEMLKEQLSRPTACVLLYGKRRVGKTSLLLEVTKNCPDKTIYFECYTGTLKYNAVKFAEKIEELGYATDINRITDFVDVFRYLSGLGETFNVIIDEYQNLMRSSKPDLIDRIFQNIVDNHIGNIRLFVCGSNIGLMKSLLNGDSSLFGRFSHVMELEEWNYLEASACYKDLPPYDKVALYSVFGGTPYVNAAINPDKSLEENIKEQFLTNGGIALNYAEQLMASASANANADTEAVLNAIGNDKKKYSELKDITRVENDNTFNVQLKTAMFLGLIKKKYPINDPENKKQAWYEISDNILRFYYTFIYKKTAQIYLLGANTFYESYIKPGLFDYISRGFEDICLSYFSLQAKAGILPGVTAIGRFNYTVNKKSDKIEVAVKYRFYYDIYEAKYYKEKLTMKTIWDETDKIEEIPGRQIDKMGFISINGFEEDCKGVMISGDDLYDENLK